MISRSSFLRHTAHAVRNCGSARPPLCRGFAAAASTGAFQSSDVSGVKVASRDSHGPTTKLSVVAKAGTRYQSLPGLTVGLEEFAFKNTKRRSALRITRESELLGGQLTASHTREVLLLEASFLREDLPYFTELLGEVVSMTKYTTHEFHEDVERVLQQKQAAFDANVPALALDYAHAVAFHSGLGTPIYPTPAASYQRYLNEEYIASFADVVYAKPNIVVVADGASPDSMSKWVGQFFREVPATPPSGQTLKAEPSKYHGGEQRTNHIGGSSMVIAFPGSGRNNAKLEIAVLAALLGGKPTIKWTPGFSLLSKATSGTSGLSVSATNLSYSDAGLLAIQLSGPAAAVRKAAEDTVKALKSVADGSISKEDVTRAVANAKFEALEKIALRDPSMLMAGSGVLHTGKPWDIAALADGLDSVTADKLKSAAKAMLDGKASVSSVGDLFVLPHAEEIGLKV